MPTGLVRSHRRPLTTTSAFAWRGPCRDHETDVEGGVPRPLNGDFGETKEVRNQIRNRSVGYGHVTDATTSEEQLKAGGSGTRLAPVEWLGQSGPRRLPGHVVLRSVWTHFADPRLSARHEPRRIVVETKPRSNGSIPIGFLDGVVKSRRRWRIRQVEESEMSSSNGSMVPWHFGCSR